MENMYYGLAAAGILATFALCWLRKSKQQALEKSTN